METSDRICAACVCDNAVRFSWTWEDLLNLDCVASDDSVVLGNRIPGNTDGVACGSSFSQVTRRGAWFWKETEVRVNMIIMRSSKNVK